MEKAWMTGGWNPAARKPFSPLAATVPPANAGGDPPAATGRMWCDQRLGLEPEEEGLAENSPTGNSMTTVSSERRRRWRIRRRQVAGKRRRMT
jgi:hypothetical protein